MTRKKHICKPSVVSIIFFIVFLAQFHDLPAQIIRSGFTAGVQACWVRLDDVSFRDTVSIRPVPGFRVGGVLSFKVKDRYFLHTEYVYSQKGKIAKGKLDPDLYDKATYRYLELPILFTMHFKGKVAKDKDFKWHIGAGPSINYWLGGKGTLTSGDLIENRIDPFDYTIVFGTRPENTALARNFYYREVNRLQLGLVAGVGLILEPADGRAFIIDLRYTFDQSRMGKVWSADIQTPTDYNDNLDARNKSFSISICYLFERNLDKKERNKGKSMIKPKQR